MVDRFERSELRSERCRRTGGGRRPKPEMGQDHFDYRGLLDEGFVASSAERRLSALLPRIGDTQGVRFVHVLDEPRPRALRL